MRTDRWALLLLVPLALAACRAPAADTEPTEEQPETMAPGAMLAAIDQVRDDWMRLARAGDAAGVAALYVDDAMMVTPEGLLEGRAAIEAAMTQMFAALAHIDLVATGTEIGQDMAADMGTFSQTLQTEGGELTMGGHYLVVLVRQSDGGWKIVQHVTAVPLPAPGGPSSEPM